MTWERKMAATCCDANLRWKWTHTQNRLQVFSAARVFRKTLQPEKTWNQFVVSEHERDGRHVLWRQLFCINPTRNSNPGYGTKNVGNSFFSPTLALSTLETILFFWFDSVFLSVFLSLLGTENLAVRQQLDEWRLAERKKGGQEF